MKKVSTLVKIALFVQIALIIYGIVKESTEMIIMCSLFLIMCVLEIRNKFYKI
jgi:hypothetical protein